MLEKDPLWASVDHVNWIKSRDLKKAVTSFGAGLLRERREGSGEGAVPPAERHYGVGQCEERL